jgi:hypothetical protein
VTNAFYGLTARASAAAGFSNDAELVLKRRKTNRHDNQTLNQVVGLENDGAASFKPLEAWQSQFHA